VQNRRSRREGRGDELISLPFPEERRRKILFFFSEGEKRGETWPPHLTPSEKGKGKGRLCLFLFFQERILVGGQCFGSRGGGKGCIFLAGGKGGKEQSPGGGKGGTGRTSY